MNIYDLKALKAAISAVFVAPGPRFFRSSVGVGRVVLGVGGEWRVKKRRVDVLFVANENTETRFREGLGREHR